MDVGKRSSFSVNGIKVKKVYSVKGAVAHLGRSLRSTIALFLRCGRLYSNLADNWWKHACTSVLDTAGVRHGLIDRIVDASKINSTDWVQQLD